MTDLTVITLYSQAMFYHFVILKSIFRGIRVFDGLYNLKLCIVIFSAVNPSWYDTFSCPLL